MKRILASFPLLVTLLAAAFSSFALTLKADPAATQQATCPYCFLPTPVGVQVLNERGLPQAGVPVMFSVPAGAAIVPDAGNGPYVVISDRNGRAAPPAPGFVTMMPDNTFTITASALGAWQGFAVTVQGPAPARVIAATDEPIALVGAQYEDAHFWLVVLDESDNIVPNAAVRFDLEDDAQTPSGRFVEGTRSATQPISLTAGTRTAFVPVSESGFAFSPLVRANHVPGNGRMRAATFGPQPRAAFIEFYNSAHGAVSIEPVAGAIPQATHQAAYFPQHAAVVVRDRAGHPQRGVAVHFTFPDGSASFEGPDGSGYFELSAMTDGEGRAVARYRILTLSGVGSIQLQVSAPEVAPNSYAMQVVPGRPARYEVISGNNQRVPAGATFARGWTVRVIDESGQPVPYASVPFLTTDVPDQAGASFVMPFVGGNNTAYVMADPEGFATSPMLRANAVPGSAAGIALGWGIDDLETPSTSFDFEVVAP